MCSQLQGSQTSALREAVEVTMRLHEGPRYEEVTPEELAAIKTAMVSGNRGIATHSGHWYNCENGHPVCFRYSSICTRSMRYFTDQLFFKMISLQSENAECRWSWRGVRSAVRRSVVIPMNLLKGPREQGIWRHDKVIVRQTISGDSYLVDS